MVLSLKIPKSKTKNNWQNSNLKINVSWLSVTLVSVRGVCGGGALIAPFPKVLASHFNKVKDTVNLKRYQIILLFQNIYSYRRL